MIYDQFVLHSVFFHIYVSLVIPITILDTAVQMIRIWLLYFDMQLSQSIRNHYWRMAINPSSVTNNWFLNPINQRRFGNNGKYLFCIGFCISSVEIACFLTFVYGFKQILIAIVVVLVCFGIKVS